jgi:hypothetical protein
MTTVNAADWKGFADHFSKQHDGWSASLQVRQSDGGIEVEVDDRPFRGVTFEHRGSHDAVILTFGDDPDEHLTHIIEKPHDLAVLDGQSGHCSLIIGLADGSGCELELASPFNAD